MKVIIQHSISAQKSRLVVNKREAPSFATRMSEQWMNLGTNLTIRLQVYGDPKPRVTWSMRVVSLLESLCTLQVPQH